MSILLGPYDKGDTSKNGGNDEELLVFGYACKLYKDDAKAILENSGQLLIPWMGDNSLMVDRYDVRNKLEDKRLFGLKPNLSHKLSAKERSLEEELNRERYLALEWDDIRVEEQEEMEKRKNENAFNAVGFVYSDNTPSAEPPPAMDSNMSLPNHPSTSSVDVDNGEGDKFIPPPGLLIPEGIHMPSTNKLHSIIEKTASFVRKQGTQMEIIIKTKQKRNPFFSFLNYEDPLFPYYKHLKEMIMTGGYRPALVTESTTNGVTRAAQSSGSSSGSGSVRQEVGKADKGLAEPRSPPVRSSRVKIVEESVRESEEESDSDSDSDTDDGYLHPLLFAAKKPSKPPTASGEGKKDVAIPATVAHHKEATVASNTAVTDKKMSMEELLGLHDTIATSSSFAAKRMAVNSAPVPNRGVASYGQVTSSQLTCGDGRGGDGIDPDALAAYKHYQRQYYESSGVRPPPPTGTAISSAGYNHQYPQDGNPAPHDAYYDQSAANNGPTQSTGYTADHQYAAATYYSHAHFQQQQQQPPYAVPPDDARPIIDKTAEYVAKNSDDFERTVLEKHIGDARFGFLNPWDQYHAYYTAMKQYFRSLADQVATTAAEQQEKPNVQKLSSSGAVSFKLQSKAGVSPVDLSSPCSGFSMKGVGEEEEEEEGLAAARNGQQECPPPAKKQRVEGSASDADIGGTVQAFLSTVKTLFKDSF